MRRVWFRRPTPTGPPVSVADMFTAARLLRVHADDGTMPWDPEGCRDVAGYLAATAYNVGETGPVYAVAVAQWGRASAQVRRVLAVSHEPPLPVGEWTP